MDDLKVRMVTNLDGTFLHAGDTIKLLELALESLPQATSKELTQVLASWIVDAAMNPAPLNPFGAMI